MDRAIIVTGLILFSAFLLGVTIHAQVSSASTIAQQTTENKTIGAEESHSDRMVAALRYLADGKSMQ